MNRILGLAIVVSLALYGCANLPPSRGDHGSKKLSCDGVNKCDVDVTVNCPPLWLACTAEVSFDPVVILGKNRLNVVWTLATPGYAFADNGIVIDDPDFDCKPDGKTRFVCMDKHTQFSVSKYTVNVTGVSPLDPWIVNQ